MNSLKDEIIRKLYELVKAVNIKNKMNLNDINNVCEEVFCEILNIIFEFDLIVLNTESNYRNIAVDLGNERKSIYVQVTSNTRKEKINETLRKFALVYETNSKLIFFLIGKKPKYSKINTYGTKFNKDTDIWDIETIINNLNDDFERNRKILLVLNKFYDSGITDIISINKKSEELTTDKIILETGKYRYGKGDVCVDAFLPKSYKDRLTLMLNFRKKEVEDAWITFGQTDAQNILFSNANTEVTSRKFVLYEHENKVWLQLLNVRFSVEHITAENLCYLLDDLKVEFDKCLDEQNELLGIKKFNRDEKGDIVLLEVPFSVWEAMFDFACERDYGLPNDKWNIFSTSSFFRDRIMICKNMNEDAEGNVLAQLFCKRKYGTYVSIVWCPGFTALDNPCEKFDNKIKWKADYTHDWLMKEFIPRALFEKERKCFQTYKAYLKNFSPLRHGICSLKENKNTY